MLNLRQLQHRPTRFSSIREPVAQPSGLLLHPSTAYWDHLFTTVGNIGEPLDSNDGEQQALSGCLKMQKTSYPEASTFTMGRV